jgi:hypothetical protein
MANLRQELETLAQRYGGTADLAREIRTIRNAQGVGTDTKKSKLEAGMDKLIQDYGNISLARFKKEAAKAWQRAFPDGIEKRELKGYQLFVKETMPRVKAEHPDKTHVERMAIIGRMWQESKGAPVEVTIEESAPRQLRARGTKRHR